MFFFSPLPTLNHLQPRLVTCRIPFSPPSHFSPSAVSRTFVKVFPSFERVMSTMRVYSKGSACRANAAPRSVEIHILPRRSRKKLLIRLLGRLYRGDDTSWLTVRLLPLSGLNTSMPYSEATSRLPSGRTRGWLYVLPDRARAVFPLTRLRCRRPCSVPTHRHLRLRSISML